MSWHFTEPEASIPPEAMMHFSLFQISSLFSKKIQTLSKIFKILPFPEIFFDLHPLKFLMASFSHRPQISNVPPIFPVSVHFPLFRENYYFPTTCTLKNFPLFSKSSPAFYKLYVYFVSPLL